MSDWDEKEMPLLGKCKICSTKTIPLYTFSWGTIEQCRHCGSEFLTPNEETNYDQTYYKSWFDDPNQKISEIKKANFKCILSKHFTKLKDKEVLDIGCATGFLLQEAKSMGAKVSGVDINEWAIKQAKNKIPDSKLFCGSLNQAIEDHFFFNDSFDIVIGTDVIEHVDDIRSFLTGVNKILKYDGSALFTTPDLTSLSRLLLKRHWFQYKSEHLCFITKIALRILSNEIGFKIDKIIPLKKNLSLGYIFNVLSDRSKGTSSVIGRLGSFVVKSGAISKRQFNFPTGEMLIIISKQ